MSVPVVQEVGGQEKLCSKTFFTRTEMYRYYRRRIKTEEKVIAAVWGLNQH